MMTGADEQQPPAKYCQDGGFCGFWGAIGFGDGPDYPPNAPDGLLCPSCAFLDGPRKMTLPAGRNQSLILTPIDLA